MTKSCFAKGFSPCIGGIFFIVGISLMVLVGWPTLRDARASSEWPSVPGQIIRSEVATHRSSDKTTYSADIAFRYQVKGVDHECDNVAFGTLSSNNSSPARQVTKRYPVGREVDVFYDPNDPGKGVLEPGTTFKSYFMLGFSGIFALVGGSVLSIPLFKLLSRLAPVLSLRGGVDVNEHDNV